MFSCHQFHYFCRCSRYCVGWLQAVMRERPPKRDSVFSSGRFSSGEMLSSLGLGTEKGICTRTRAPHQRVHPGPLLCTDFEPAPCTSTPASRACSVEASGEVAGAARGLTAQAPPKPPPPSTAPCHLGSRVFHSPRRVGNVELLPFRDPVGLSP